VWTLGRELSSWVSDLPFFGKAGAPGRIQGYLWHLLPRYPALFMLSSRVLTSVLPWLLLVLGKFRWSMIKLTEIDICWREL
jgi:hypothetical protein